MPVQPLTSTDYKALTSQMPDSLRKYRVIMKPGWDPCCRHTIHFEFSLYQPISNLSHCQSKLLEELAVSLRPHSSWIIN